MAIHRVIVGGGVAVWLGSLAASAAAFERYARTPGSVGVSAPAVDAEEAGKEWRVTMYAHPKCPCTRASLAELARVAEAVGAGVSVEYVVVMYRPRSEEDGWVRGRSWDLASQIADARIVVDPDGLMATRAGAMTSGHVVVRNRAGAVVYAGGVTNGRGETGASAAGDAIVDVLRGGESALSVGPVFGCAITGREAMAGEGGVP